MTESLAKPRVASLPRGAARGLDGRMAMGLGRVSPAVEGANFLATGKLIDRRATSLPRQCSRNAACLHVTRHSPRRRRVGAGARHVRARGGGDGGRCRRRARRTRRRRGAHEVQERRLLRVPADALDAAEGERVAAVPDIERGLDVLVLVLEPRAPPVASTRPQHRVNERTRNADCFLESRSFLSADDDNGHPGRNGIANEGGGNGIGDSVVPS